MAIESHNNDESGINQKLKQNPYVDENNINSDCAGWFWSKLNKSSRPFIVSGHTAKSPN